MIFIQAWVKAVNLDLTFIIFNCGSHERIGIRHRASQTLFLSELIGTVHTSPSYGLIQLGLHIAILQDALDRMKARQMFNTENKTTLKKEVARRLESDEDMAHKYISSEGVDS